MKISTFVVKGSLKNKKTNQNQLRSAIWEKYITIYGNRRMRNTAHGASQNRFWEGGTEMTGEFEHTVDAKGRMNFPAKIRDEFGEHFYIAKSYYSKCLQVYNEASWQELKDKLAAQPSKVSVPLERFLFGSACEVEPDKQGRIAIASALRAYANITSEVVVVSMFSRTEIWDKQSWIDYNSNMDLDDIAGLAEEANL